LRFSNILPIAAKLLFFLIANGKINSYPFYGFTIMAGIMLF